MTLNVTNKNWTDLGLCIYAGFMAYLVAFILLNFFYLWARIRNDISVIDIYWSLGFLATTVTAFLELNIKSNHQWVLMTLVAIWSLRLSIYLAWRLLSHGKEDPRYTAMREGWSDFIWPKAYVRVYLLQFVLMSLISVPLFFYMVPSLESEIRTNHIAALVLFTYGFIFQVWGDFGLARFKANPKNKGKIYTQGAWRYSQHPNYFGEAAIWVGFYLFCFHISPWWTVIGPITIIFFLLKVSGIPMLNRDEKYSGDEKYRDYKKKTSLFIPWFPEG